MPKYNITDKKQKSPLYRSLLSAGTVEDLYQRIMEKFIVEKRYRDPKFSAAVLAMELGTNTRYISAVVNMRYRDNYSQMVNEFRIKDAMYMLSDKHCARMTMEEIGNAVGFANRQCFYAAFFKRLGITPRQYRQQQMALLKEKIDEKRTKKNSRKAESE